MDNIENQMEINQEEPRFIGFWPRVAAPMVGFYFLGMILPLLALTIIKILYAAGFIYTSFNNTVEMLAAFSGLIFAVSGAGATIASFYIAYILYLALMESSTRQASLGKYMIGARVVGYGGGRISLGRALARNFLKPLSVLTIIGVVMMGFTQRKQALHDKICNTFVIRNN